MTRIHPDLYLPINQELLDQIIDGGANNLEKTTSTLGIPQTASLLLIQNLSNEKSKQAAHCESILAKNINTLDSLLKNDESFSIRAEVLSKFNFKNIQEGLKLLTSFGIELLSEQEIRNKNYLTIEGGWDFNFNKRHTKKLRGSLVQLNDNVIGNVQTLTSEQSRVYRDIDAQIDDHMHVQGYAGTGKSSLIRNLLSLLDRKGVQVLILAERRKQIDALVSGIGHMEHVVAKTFAGLAYEIIPQDLTAPINRRMRQRSTSFPEVVKDEAVIRHFNIMASSTSTANSIARAIRSTLWGFCHNGEKSIQPNHLPKWCASTFDEVTKQIVLHYATELWKEILNPTSKDFKPHVRGYHRIKWAALNDWQIPARYTHILIDECHNLSKPMLQLLDSSQQAVISLGDEYQNLQGKSQQRSNIIRYREITHSVRSGCLLENIINSIITIHPGKIKDRFYGNQLNSLDITYYNKPKIPDKPATILVSDMWGLFEWAQRIAKKGLNLNLLTNMENLNKFVSDCIELRGGDIRPRHGELFRFKAWGDLAKHYHDNQSFQRIHRMLDSGYRYEDWERTLGKLNKGSPLSYSLGKIEDVRNYEFQTVMVIPQVVSLVWQAKPEDIGAITSSIYVAVTRAKQHLILPESLRNWVEEISAS